MFICVILNSFVGSLCFWQLVQQILLSQSTQELEQFVHKLLRSNLFLDRFTFWLLYHKIHTISSSFPLIEELKVNLTEIEFSFVYLTEILNRRHEMGLKVHSSFCFRFVAIGILFFSKSKDKEAAEGKIWRVVCKFACLLWVTYWFLPG